MILKNKPQKALLLILSVLVLLGIGIGGYYYSQQNQGNDPRVIEAHSLYSKYDGYAEQRDFAAVFQLLDSIETIYKQVPYYENSYELGALYNYRCATYLTIALYIDDHSLNLHGANVMSKDSLMRLAFKNAKISERYYNTWHDRYGNLSEDKLHQKVANAFYVDFSDYKLKQVDAIIEKRWEEEKVAQVEMPRILSAVYTNLGIIKGHQAQLEIAIMYYEKAINCWGENLTAQNNLSKLLGNPIERRDFVKKALPPDKNKK